jgi:hypothetical protein
VANRMHSHSASSQMLALLMEVEPRHTPLGERLGHYVRVKCCSTESRCVHTGTRCGCYEIDIMFLTYLSSLARAAGRGLSADICRILRLLLSRSLSLSLALSLCLQVAVSAYVRRSGLSPVREGKIRRR